MGTNTTNLNLYKPGDDETGWGAEVNGNFDTLDNAIITTNAASEGKIPIGQPDGSVAFADPLVQGLQAEGTTTTGLNPVLVSGKGDDGNQHDIATDDSGVVKTTVTNFPVLYPIGSGDGMPLATDASYNLVVNIGAVDMGTVPVSGSVSVSGSVGIAPATSGGLSTYSGSIGATKTSVKASAGQLYGWYVGNPNTSAVYVQIFDTALASITVGSTTPKLSLMIPAGGAANVLHDVGIEFSTAIAFACTTTRSGSTGPAATVDVNFFYE